MPVQQTIPLSVQSGTALGVEVFLSQSCATKSSVTYTHVDPEVTLTSSSITIDSPFGDCANITGTIKIIGSFEGLRYADSISFKPTYIPAAKPEIEVRNTSGIVITDVDLGLFDQNTTQRFYFDIYNVGDEILNVGAITSSNPKVVLPPNVGNYITPPTLFKRVTLELDTSDPGEVISFITIVSDDEDENPYTLRVRYEVIPEPVPCQEQIIQARIDYVSGSNPTNWIERASTDATTIGISSKSVNLISFDGSITITRINTTPFPDSNQIQISDVAPTRTSTWTLNNGLVLEERIPPIGRYFGAFADIISVAETAPGSGIFIAKVRFYALDHVDDQRTEPNRTFRVIGTVDGQTFDSGDISSGTLGVNTSVLYNDYRWGTVPGNGNYGIYRDVTVQVNAANSPFEVTCTATQLPNTDVGFVRYYFTVNCP